MNSEIITAILGLITLYFGVRWEGSRRENEALKQKLNEKKEQLYSDLIKMYFELTNNPNTNQEQLIKKIREFNQQMILVGSNKVILTYGDFMQCLFINEGNNSKNILRMLGELILAMREDLGHKDFMNNLYWFDTLRPWIKDINSILPKKYSGSRRFYSKLVNPKA